jgi:uncharacterized protein (TIGR00297 family)
MLRHLIHALVGLAVFVSPWVFEGPLVPYAVAGFFVVLNMIALRFRWFGFMHEGRWSSWGTVAYPLALICVLPFTWDETGDRVYIMQVSFVVMSLADPVAAVIGTRLGFVHGLPRFVRGKSLGGSIAFGIVAWIVSGISLTICYRFGSIGFDPMWIWHIAATSAILLAAVEALVRRGWDNLALVCTGAILLLALHGDDHAIRILGWWTLLAIGFAVASYWMRFLDASGSLTAGLFGVTILVLADPVWLVPPVTFFLLSSLLSGCSRRLRGPDALIQARGSRRDSVQVLANGGVGWLLLAVHWVWPAEHWFWIYTATFAAAAADTWATEVGTAVRGKTVSVIGWRPVPPGSSGGVSVAGSVASVLGAVSVLLASAYVVEPMSFGRVAMAVVGGGILGSSVDSILGASLQAIYRDASGSRFESTDGGGDGLELVRGWAWVNNDTVNVVCTIAGSLFAAVVLY